MSTLRWHGIVAVLAVAACAGLALAQAPDQFITAPPRERPQRPERGVMARRAAPGLLLMLVDDEPASFQVVNTDEGVDLQITAEAPTQPVDLQARVEAGVMRLQETIARRRERAGNGRGPVGQGRGLAASLAGGDVVLTTRNTDDGIVVSFASDDPQVVKALQEEMPLWAAGLAEAGERARAVRERLRKAQEAMELLASNEIVVSVADAENGITITVTSDNPEIVKQIKEKLADYYRGQQELARTAGIGALRPGGPIGQRAFMRQREREGAER